MDWTRMTPGNRLKLLVAVDWLLRPWPTNLAAACKLANAPEDVLCNVHHRATRQNAKFGSVHDLAPPMAASMIETNPALRRSTVSSVELRNWTGAKGRPFGPDVGFEVPARGASSNRLPCQSPEMF